MIMISVRYWLVGAAAVAYLFGSVTLFPVCELAAQPKEHKVEGKIVEIVPSKKEIYVMADSEKHEYYFLPSTRVAGPNGEASFGDLKRGQRVRVEALKVGKRLDPQVVTLLE